MPRAIVPEEYRCKATKVDGTPCTLRAVRGSDRCIAHRPEAAENRRQGGQNSAVVRRIDGMLPTRLRPLLELLETAMREVHMGELRASSGSAMASLAAAICKVYETGLIEEKLGQLERMLEEGREYGNENRQPW